MRARLIAVLAVALTAGTLVPAARAAAAPPVSTRTGAGANADRSTPGNWQGGQVPGSGSALVFPSDVGSLPQPVDDIAGLSVTSITVDGPNYSFLGNLPLRITGGFEVNPSDVSAKLY